MNATEGVFSSLFYFIPICYWAWVTCVIGRYLRHCSDCSNYILYTRSRLCAKIAWPEGVVHTTNDGWDVYGEEYYSVVKKKKEIILKNSCAIFYSIALYIFTSILMISFFFTVIQLKIIIIYTT